MNLIEKAIQVAAKAHDQQYRKSTGTPYISHPFSVGMYLLKAGCSEQVVAAGILHDVVEDTDLSIEQIIELFGSEVATIVEGCSEPDKTQSWEKRKQHTIDFLREASLEIKLVACADKLHNVKSILEEQQRVGEKVWESFKRGREKQAWYYTGIWESLTHNLPNQHQDLLIFRELRAAIHTLFGESGR